MQASDKVVEGINMQQLYFKGKTYQGLEEVVSPADGGLMAFKLLKLGAGGDYEALSGEYEIALVILSGSAHVTVDGEVFSGLGERRDVFSGRAATAYIPRDSQFRVEAAAGEVEAALCLVKADKQYPAFVVKPEEVMINHRGGQSWKRDVHDIIVENGEGRVDRIVLGETYSAPGNWSSFPPHKHDRSIPAEETELAEIYHFRIKPEEGFAVQVMYSEDREIDEAFLIRDKDSINIPKGYHPVVAPPSVKAYYLWFLAGEKGRVLQPYDDPTFKSLKALE